MHIYLKQILNHVWKMGDMENSLNKLWGILIKLPNWMLLSIIIFMMKLISIKVMYGDVMGYVKINSLIMAM